jgi:radical SAM superfamily enzyme YgiQ (UPF0313 family)
MKVVLISMPDVVPIVIHDMAVHMPNHGIACIGGNIDPQHEVFIIDLVRKRGNVAGYLRKTLGKIKPGLIGLSAMTWQYRTCLAIVGLIREILPGTKIALGGYHTTLLAREIAGSDEADGVDFMIRGEGEEVFRRLANALDEKGGTDRVEDIPGLSFRNNGQWIHNDPGQLCDLSKLKLPIRDKRRLTSGYHAMFARVEVMETSRGCTRNCNFCSISHMYGRSYRTYPVERIIADLDDIYYNKKTRIVFITDDNMLLNPRWVEEVCDAIIRRKYDGLKIVVQADCVSIARHAKVVEKMAQAGFGAVFLGMESASERNLKEMDKSEIIAQAKQAVENCHRCGIMVMGGLIFGMPGDDEESIRRNYQFLKDVNADTSYCQMLSPFPKTVIREHLLEEGLVTNLDGFERYNGMWANVKTRHISAERLQYLFWLHRQITLGWWRPSVYAQNMGKSWTQVWLHAVKPVMRFFVERRTRREGWENRYRRYIRRLERINHFPDLEKYYRR